MLCVPVWLAAVCPVLRVLQAVFIINALHLRALVLRRAIASREVLYIIWTGWGRSLSLSSHFRTSSTSSLQSGTILRRAHEQTKKSEKNGETGVVRDRQPALATALAARAALGSSAGRPASICSSRSMVEAPRSSARTLAARR